MADDDVDAALSAEAEAVTDVLTSDTRQPTSGAPGPGQAPVASAPPWWDAAVGRSRVVVALAVTLLISKLPEIVLRDVLSVGVPWISWAPLGLTVLLWLASRVVDWLKPLERYLAVMIVLGTAVALAGLLFDSALWATLVPPTTQPMIALLASRLVLLAGAFVVLGAALALGASRDEAYVRAGDLDAPTRRRRKDGSYVGWMRFGPIAIVGLMLLMVWFALPQLPDQVDIAAALPFIGVGAVAALCNAFWEEAAFRAAPLSMLQRAIGPSIGILILALWFGIGHYYGGIPSGPTGLLAASALAVLFGRAMIETRGLGWPVALHFAGDLVIFTFLALASVG